MQTVRPEHKHLLACNQQKIRLTSCCRCQILTFLTLNSHTEFLPFIPSDACRVIFSWLKVISLKEELQLMQVRQLSLKVTAKSIYGFMNEPSKTVKASAKGRQRRVKK
jgi:hypothetical protein